jgi:hypothetical protein
MSERKYDYCIPKSILARAMSSVGSSTERTKYCVNISNAFRDHTSEIASNEQSREKNVTFINCGNKKFA